MLIERMIRAARLEIGLYEEVEHDTTATTQALTVVVIVALAQAISAGISGATGQAGGNIIVRIVGAILFALVGWAVWSYVTYFVGTRMFGGTATPGELLRCIGFAQSPQVLAILTFIPCLGAIIGLVVAIWSLIAGVIAVRQALDFDTGKAIITVIIGWVIILVLSLILGLLGLGVGLGAGALTGGSAF